MIKTAPLRSAASARPALRAQAQAVMGQGRCLLTLRQPADALVPLRMAREIFTSLGARPALTDVDRLLAQALAATA